MRACTSLYNQPMGGMCPVYGVSGPVPPYIAHQPVNQLPTGIPTGPSPTPLVPAGAMPVPITEQPPQTLQSIMYTPGFLRTQIGKKMRVEFLIGTNAPLIDRTGTLVGVGASYILLQLIETDDIMLGDLYSIKFVTLLL